MKFKAILDDITWGNELPNEQNKIALNVTAPRTHTAAIQALSSIPPTLNSTEKKNEHTLKQHEWVDEIISFIESGIDVFINPDHSLHRNPRDIPRSPSYSHRPDGKQWWVVKGVRQAVETIS
jgi:hypothetical protein